MNSNSAGWLRPLLMVGGLGALVTTPGAAQTNQRDAAVATASAITLTKEERASMAPVQTAIQAKDWAAAQAALPAATAIVTSPGGRYAIGRFQLEIGTGTNNVTMQADGIDNLIASGQLKAADLPTVYRNQGVLALNAGKKQKAEAAFAKVVELQPSDAEAYIALAQVRSGLGKAVEAVQLISRAIELKRASGQKVDESWYKYALKLAFDGRADPTLREMSQKLSRDLVSAYPSKENWRDSLLVFRQSNNLDAATELDVLRLMRASGALAGERDWYDLADGLYKAGYFAEAKAVLDDGIAKNMINPQKPAFAEMVRLTVARMNGDRASLVTEESNAMAAASGKLAFNIGSAIDGYGEHAKAIELFRTALSKGGVDANVVNTRLGMALVASGDRAGAERAFKSLTGLRRTLGAFWLTWLAQRGV